MLVFLTLLFIILVIASILGLLSPKLILCKDRKIPIVLLVLCIMFLPALGQYGAAISKEREKRWATLKVSNPTQYLQELKQHQPKRWLTEIKELDPKQYKIELVKVKKEKARIAKVEAEKARRKREAQVHERCKSTGAQIDAYVIIVQPAIERLLKSPATADFPSFRNIRSAPSSKCSIQIVGYVDSQNSFGAMLRTRYRAKVTRDPNRENMWRLDSLKFLN